MLKVNRNGAWYGSISRESVRKLDGWIRLRSACFNWRAGSHFDSAARNGIHSIAPIQTDTRGGADLKWWVGLTLASTALLMPSCSDETGAAGGSSVGGSASSAMGGSGGGLFTTGSTGNTGGDGGSGGDDSCAGDVKPAELLPLAMILMLDRSLSMEEDTDTPGVTKWDSVKSALSDFATDTQSAGIAVGLQYFPANPPCSNNTDCPASSCYLLACNNSATPSPCQSDVECPAQLVGSCVPLGQCGAATCTDVGGTCDGTTPCVAVSDSVCVTADICAVSDYSTPQVAIAPLPGSAGAITASLNTHFPTPIPFGFTPTGPALKGAITYAQSFAAANQGQRTIVVLATDGSPTQCAPAGSAAVAGLAAVGYGSDPSVQTFTIGVFAPGDVVGPANIQAIAESGGGKAFVLDAMANVTQQFIDALNAIRTEGRLCEYAIPEPPPGQTIDYGRVNLDVDGATIPYVGFPSNCDSVTGGWYYDVNPTQGTPTQIRLCEASCGELDSVGSTVEIRVGCATVVPA